jgi:hypothetical protein
MKVLFTYIYVPTILTHFFYKYHGHDKLMCPFHVHVDGLRKEMKNSYKDKRLVIKKGMR